MKRLLFSFLNFLPKHTAYAHCDIPCGVYDPTPAQIAAHTVLRMTQLLNEKDSMHDVARIVHVKEEHGERVEDELGTLENDYFKEEHFVKYPKLKTIIEEAVQLSIKTRQTIDIDLANALLEKVMQVAEIFYKTKNVTPLRVPSVYPTKGEIVTFKA